MGRILERCFPMVLSIISIVILFFIEVDKIDNLKDIVTSIITFASIIIGFLTTMLSILVTSNDKKIINYIKKKNKLKDLYLFLAVPIVVGLALIIIYFMVIPIVDKSNLNSYIRFYVASFILFYFILLCIRAIIVLLFLIFEFIDKDGDDDDDDDDLDTSNAFNQNKNDEGL